MYKTTSDNVRTIASTILASEGGMPRNKAIKTLLDMDPAQLRQLSKIDPAQSMKEAGALSTALQAGLLALTILMPAANAQERSSTLESIAKAKEQIQEARKDTNAAAGIVSISGKKYIGSTKGQLDFLRTLSKLDNEMKNKEMDVDARDGLISNMAQAAGINPAK